MGFWNFMKKMATGKPVFEDTPRSPQVEHAGWVDHITGPAVNPSPFVDERGNKIIPQLSIERCKSHINGEHLDVTAWMTNESPFEVEVQAMTMLDTKTVIGRRLSPQDGHEVMLYRGNVPINDHAHKAQLYYKIVQNGDSFCADFMIEFNRESNGTFTVEQLHPDHIVHDV